MADQAVKDGDLSLEPAQETGKEKLLGEKQEDGTRPINSNIDLGKNGSFLV